MSTRSWPARPLPNGYGILRAGACLQGCSSFLFAHKTCTVPALSSNNFLRQNCRTSSTVSALECQLRVNHSPFFCRTKTEERMIMASVGFCKKGSLLNHSGGLLVNAAPTCNMCLRGATGRHKSQIVYSSCHRGCSGTLRPLPAPIRLLARVSCCLHHVPLPLSLSRPSGRLLPRTPPLCSLAPLA